MFTGTKRIGNVRLYCRSMDVALLRWPTETTRRDSLVAAGVPRLLLVEPGVEPPLPADCLEDWTRVPALEDDVRARTAGLEVRSRAHNHVVPELDGHGVLRLGAGWVPLPPVEARLTAALIARFGGVVSRESLSRAGWPAGRRVATPSTCTCCACAGA